MNNLEGVTIEQARKLIPEQIAREICSVQPIDNIDFEALANDPIAQALLGRFFVRHALSQTL